jgi:hypothetical protein
MLGRPVRKPTEAKTPSKLKVYKTNLLTTFWEKVEPKPTTDGVSTFWEKVEPKITNKIYIVFVSIEFHIFSWTHPCLFCP